MAGSFVCGCRRYRLAYVLLRAVDRRSESETALRMSPSLSGPRLLRSPRESLYISNMNKRNLIFTIVAIYQSQYQRYGAPPAAWRRGL